MKYNLIGWDDEWAYQLKSPSILTPEPYFVHFTTKHRAAKIVDDEHLFCGKDRAIGGRIECSNVYAYNVSHAVVTQCFATMPGRINHDSVALFFKSIGNWDLFPEEAVSVQSVKLIDLEVLSFTEGMELLK